MVEEKNKEAVDAENKVEEETSKTEEVNKDNNDKVERLSLIHI